MKNRRIITFILVAVILSSVFIQAGFAEGINLDTINRDGHFEGYFKEDLGGNRIKVATYAGEEVFLRLSPGVAYEIDGYNMTENKDQPEEGQDEEDIPKERRVRLDDYSSNQEIYAVIRNGSVTYIDGVDKVKNHPSIYEEGGREGTLRRVRYGRLEFEDEMGRPFKIPVTRDTKYQINNKSQQNSSRASLKAGMKINVRLDGRKAGLVTAMDSKGTGTFYMEGTHRGYENQRLTIRRENGTDVSYPVDKDAKMTVDGRPVNIEEFRPGMFIFLKVSGGLIKEVETFSTTEPGYVQPNSTVETGIIKNIDRNQLQVIYANGKEDTVFLTPATIILRSGMNSKANTLYVGDNIKMYFEDTNSKNINKIQVEGKSVEIKQVIKGDLNNADQLTDNVYLDDVDVLRNNDWQDFSPGIRLGFNNKVPIHMGGTKVNNRNLKDYKGRTAYAAIKDQLGKDQIEKMVIKSDYEQTFSSKIENVNWMSSQIELSSGQNIMVNDGTMVIKSGRLVDMKSINPNSDAYIVADGFAGSLTANLIHIFDENLNNSNIGQENLYAGRVDRIFSDKISLLDFFLLDEHEWVSFDDKKELYYDNDTFIYDMKEGKKIPAKSFFGSKYSVDEDNNRRRERDWYAYVYADGNRITGIFLQPRMDSLLRQRVTTGVIEAKPNEDIHMGWRLKVRDAKDWSTTREEWIAKNATLNLYLKDAVIMKNGKLVELKNLNVGDRLYITRDSNMAKVIIVK